MSELRRNQILVGDVRERLGEVPDASIDCVITSPPYFHLRDYGIGGQIGLEESVGVWVDELRLVLNGLKRVLKPIGSMWLNLGDTYSRHTKYGASAKSLLLAPERLLIALSDDGWIVRNKVIWAKTNPMPHSVADRLTNSYDLVYFLTRSPRYYFDLDTIRLPHRSTPPSDRAQRSYPPAHAGAPHWRQHGGGNRGLGAQRARGVVGHRLGKNPGDVWPLGSANYHGAHFATFPPALVERPLLATCPERLCIRCGTPHRRAARVTRVELPAPSRQTRRAARLVYHFDKKYRVYRELGLLKPDCSCKAGSRPGVVLDPFLGAGTVALVAEQHRRDWLGIELNPTYAKLAEKRLADDRARRAGDVPPADMTQDEVVAADKPSTSEGGEP
jgi:DNA modification methylase